MMGIANIALNILFLTNINNKIMCNINTLTKLKRKTVYKLCVKIDGKYYSYYSGFLMKTGPVKFDNIPPSTEGWVDYEHTDLFNPNMVGKCCGFEDLIKFKNMITSSCINVDSCVILEVSLSGIIMKGVESHLQAYSGSIIKSFKEIEVL